MRLICLCCASLLVAISTMHALASETTVERLAQISNALSKGNSAQAEQLAEVALHDENLSSQERALLLSNLALAKHLSGQTRDALADYTAAIDSHALSSADQVTALLERGVLFESLNHLRDAIKDYSTVYN